MLPVVVPNVVLIIAGVVGIFGRVDVAGGSGAADILVVIASLAVLFYMFLFFQLGFPACDPGSWLVLVGVRGWVQWSAINPLLTTRAEPRNMVANWRSAKKAKANSHFPLSSWHLENWPCFWKISMAIQQNCSFDNDFPAAAWKTNSQESTHALIAAL